jgi:uncharacterized surface protein with fasciclin (FAS1) repeats
MKNYFSKPFLRLEKVLIILAIGISLLGSSCTDDYYYDNKEPEWLGASIYDYLKNDGHFTYYVKLIDDLKYNDVLSLTGSKTLFVATDSSFVEFLKNNKWGVTSYDQLTLAQKKLLLNFSMINNAYILETLSNYYDGNFNEGTAMRRETALSALDSIPFEMGDKLPASSYWNNYRTKGLYLLKDNTPKPTVYFTQSFIDKYSFTDEDFMTLTGSSGRSRNDVHIFNDKVIVRDITCKNGYIQVLQSVLVPPENMAQYIEDNSNTKIFSKLLDRFCAPFYDPAFTITYKSTHPEFTDSIFTKHYFASIGGSMTLPSKSPAPNLLPFDPGWNTYKTTALQADMAAMFVPSDEAMNNYFNSGVGEILKSRFHSWDSIPDAIILPFLKRHMRSSLIESVPSRFSKMVDAENYRLPVTKSDIEKTYTGVNGQVYVTNTVYPPVDYISVYSPVLLSANSKIMNWAINISETSVDGTKFAFYKLYLNSLVSKYSLFIPTDEFFNKYVDPIAYGQDVPGVLKFWYYEKTGTVYATVYKYDKVNNIVGDSVDLITSPTFLKNRLWAILDSHIVVGDVESGNKYYITKANDFIKVDGTDNSMTVQGGQDILNNTKAQVTKVFNQYNGNTYFLNKPISPALRSVYNVLSTNDNFKEFFNLLNGVPEQNIDQIFAQQGVDYRIKFFNAFRYTVYVPTNQSILDAINSHQISTWETINTMASPAKEAAINKMIRFLKYHFQDNAVFFGQTVNEQYQSATIKDDTTATLFGTAKNKYLKIGVVGTSNSLTLTMDTKLKDGNGNFIIKTAHVIPQNDLNNIIVKDYIFAKIPTGASGYKNIDGTGSVSGALFNTSSITTSASAVIHQIDNVLTFE